MKKSILVGVLAALMLFAFTACEPSSIVMQDGTVASPAAYAVLDNPNFYAGSSELAAGKFVSATVHTEDGSKIPMMGTVTLSTINVGENIATFTYGAGAGSESNTQTTVNAVVNGIGINAITLDTSKVKSTYTMEEVETLAPESADDFMTGAVASYKWADGTEAESTDATVNYEYKVDPTDPEFNGTIVIVAKATGNKVDTTATVTAEFTITITDYKAPEAPAATSWILFIGDAEDIPAIGETVTASEDGAIDVEFGDSRSVATDQIHVLGVIGSSSYTLVEVIDPSKYTVYGLPSTFNEKSVDTITGSYNYVIESKEYVDVTMSNLEGTVTVADPLKLSTVQVKWNGDSEYVPTVGGALPTAADDFTVVAKTNSGKDVSGNVELAVVHPSAIYAEDKGNKITFTVTVSYDSKIVDTVKVQCPTAVEE